MNNYQHLKLAIEIVESKLKKLDEAISALKKLFDNPTSYESKDPEYCGISGVKLND